jgi:predicted lactoylglutathione lyase
MSTQIFVNLPVKDLSRSIDFWTKVGYTFNQQFTDENAGALVIDDESGIYAMLLTEDFFRTFHKSEIADPARQREVVLALGVESKDRVNEIVDNAVSAGGEATGDPQDQGFMYSRGFNDPDGHHWEVHWMDPATVQPQ